jgi:N6-L-threonylcarbamoyladenine synthase
MSEGPLIIGFETSCDETGVGVVQGESVLANVIASQVEEHARFGGVVPEVAARAHVEAIRSLTHRALRTAGVHPTDVDAIAATRGPGLAGALMVGFSYGKALAWALRKPFLGIDHMEGHLVAPRLEDEAFEPPAVVLLASGGHSQIVHVAGWGSYRTVGSTIDDAAGEALDKIARFLGLGYPGGPAIDREAREGNPKAVTFPRALPDRPFDLSFSGLKTAVITYVREHHREGTLPTIPDLAASIQEAVVDVLVDKTMNVVEETGARRVSGGGGVMSNRRLRERLAAACEERGLDLHLPSPLLCTDNGAMIAGAAVRRFLDGERTPWDAEIDPGLRLG